MLGPIGKRRRGLALAVTNTLAAELPPPPLLGVRRARWPSPVRQACGCAGLCLITSISIMEAQGGRAPNGRTDGGTLAPGRSFPPPLLVSQPVGCQAL